VRGEGGGKGRGARGREGGLKTLLLCPRRHSPSLPPPPNTQTNPKKQFKNKKVRISKQRVVTFPLIPLSLRPPLPFRISQGFWVGGWGGRGGGDTLGQDRLRSSLLPLFVGPAVHPPPPFKRRWGVGRAVFIRSQKRHDTKRNGRHKQKPTGDGAVGAGGRAGLAGVGGVPSPSPVFLAYSFSPPPQHSLATADRKTWW